MPKGRIYLSVDLVNEELKKKLMDMVVEDIAIHGEATPSTLVRNLIRDEWNRRHPPAPQVVPDLTDEQWKQLRKNLQLDSPAAGVS